MLPATFGDVPSGFNEDRKTAKEKMIHLCHILDNRPLLCQSSIRLPSSSEEQVRNCLAPGGVDGTVNLVSVRCNGASRNDMADELGVGVPLDALEGIGQTPGAFLRREEIFRIKAWRQHRSSASSTIGLAVNEHSEDG